MIVEIPILPEHIVMECSERANYPFRLSTCPKCRNCIDERGFQEHVAQCPAVLAGEQSICPLCNETMQDTEAALDHYAEKKCEANPRTTEKLRQIVAQKLHGAEE